jgi:hypothetical protein
MSQSQQQMQASIDPEHNTLPPGSVSASPSGFYRPNHRTLARDAYRATMQQQNRETHPDKRAQQMAMQSEI